MKGNEDMMRQARKQRELLLLRYTDALSNGDLESLGSILEQAMNDPELEKSLWETHLALGEEIRLEETQAISEQLKRDSEFVGAMAASHFAPSDNSISQVFPQNEELYPVTVAEVAANLRDRVDTNSRDLLRKIEHSTAPLGEDVSPRGLRTLLANLGIENVSKKFLRAFQDAGMTLGMQRQGQAFQLAATRRQQAGSDRTKEARPSYPSAAPVVEPDENEPPETTENKEPEA